ncbi:MAG: amino acid adenylation domain-containing protein, partial [bacterium]|nr:amino acid adenylation domain-containing protein [bacterium]
EELQPQRDAGSNPLFQVMFVFQNLTWRRRELPEVTFSPLPPDGVTAKFDLTLLLEQREADIGGVVEYSTELFDDTTMQRLRGHFQCLLREIVADPDRRVWQLPLLSPAERHQLLREWNVAAALGHRGQPPETATLGELFGARVKRTPEAVAVVCGPRVLSYRELDVRADRVARHLRALGVGPEIPVAIAGDRGPELVVGLWGILKAGGVYLPLDPTLPADRLSFMLKDAGAPVVLVREAAAGAVLPAAAAAGAGDGIRVVSLDGPGAEVPAAAGSEDRESLPDPDQLAYVIYTSGSTGVPKGVMVSHRGVVPILTWSLRRYPIDEHSRVLQTVSYCFDLGWFEMVATLLGGGMLCFPAAAEQEDPARYPELIERHAVNMVHTTPSLFRELVAQGRSLPALETVRVGAEPLSRELVRQIAGVVGRRCQVHHSYGVTEAAITSALFTLRERPPDRGLEETPVPIGRGTARSSLYVADRFGRPVPMGVVGELWIGGPGLARGYLGKPARTAERFVPAPHFADPQPGERVYRTGDLVRLHTDGTLAFVGRIDHQVKVRGLRIELGEIEAVLSQHSAVEAAAVVAREDLPGRPGEKRLVAYVVAAADAEIDHTELRGLLTGKLPEYMVPSAFALLDALPSTPSGKVARSALPAPETVRLAGQRGYVAPRDPLELALAQLWQELLGVDRVGVHDDFFALGGHSLMAVRLMAAIRARIGHDLPLQVLFRGPTVEGLAAILRQDGELRRSPLVEIQGGGSRLPLFCIHPVGGIVLCYCALARALGADQPVYAHQALGLAEGEEPQQRIDEMAAEYLRSIRGVWPQGPYALLGWSLGGVVAYEMARQLVAEGREVALVALVDSRARRGDAPRLRSDAELLAYLVSDEITVDLEPLRHLDGEARLAAVLGEAKAAGILPPDFTLADVRRYLRVHRTNSEARWAYTPGPYAGKVVLLRATEESPESAADETLGWRHAVQGELTIHQVPGSHETLIFSPHVHSLAEHLRRLLDPFSDLDDLSH